MTLTCLLHLPTAYFYETLQIQPNSLLLWSSMKSKSFQRALLLVSGFCAVLVILLSQSFYQTTSVPAKSKTEKASGKTEIAIHAPADVAAQGQAVELNHAQPPVLEKLILADDKNEKAVFIQKIATNFFRTLFRVIISPNAP
jgi:hypothetical protein